MRQLSGPAEQRAEHHDGERSDNAAGDSACHVQGETEAGEAGGGGGTTLLHMRQAIAHNNLPGLTADEGGNRLCATQDQSELAKTLRAEGAGSQRQVDQA